MTDIFNGAVTDPFGDAVVVTPEAPAAPTITVPQQAIEVATPLPKKRRKAPGEGTTRRDDDAYDTEPACALGCTQWLERKLRYGGTFETTKGRNILEPTAGNGSFVKAARQVWPGANIVAGDVNDHREACKLAGASHAIMADALTLPTILIGKADLILSNPPFKLADALIRHFWPHMKDGASLCFLLAVTFVASDERLDATDGLYRFSPLRTVGPIDPRPSFGMDSPKFEAGMFLFTKGWGQGGDYPPEATIDIYDPARWIRPPKPRKSRKGSTGGST